MLIEKQRSELRGIAQTRKSLFQMGKDAINENLIKTISDSLEAHKLVKVSPLKTCVITANETAVTISAAAHSEVIQVTERTFTLYRRGKKNKLGLQYMRVAVLGGAFDPIHNGHLQIAKQALRQLRVDEVWFMPSAAAPLKQMQAASFSDRAAMVTLAIRSYRRMKLCTLKHELEGVSYFMRTVKELKKRYPKYSFCWLIGDNQARQFDRWKDSEDPKQQLPFYMFSGEQYIEQLSAGLQRVVMQLIPVSSSEIRKGYKLYQVPEAVRAYMGLHALYLGGMVKEQVDEHRYPHSQSVAQLCVELAQAHGLDTGVAYIMGIAHDVCKQLPYEKVKTWMRAHMPDHPEEAAAIWHGYIGVDYVNKMFHIRSRRILQAIHHHVKGRNRADFDRILSIADKLDPPCDYDSRREIEISRKNLRESYRVVKQQQEAYLREEGTLK